MFDDTIADMESNKKGSNGVTSDFWVTSDTYALRS